jgi:hypothetical protein
MYREGIKDGMNLKKITGWMIFELWSSHAFFETIS